MENKRWGGRERGKRNEKLRDMKRECAKVKDVTNKEYKAQIKHHSSHPLYMRKPGSSVS